MSTDPGAAARARHGPLDQRLLSRAPRARASLAASVVLGVVSAASIAGQALLLARLLASVFPGAKPGAGRVWLFGGLAALVALRALCALAGELLARSGASKVKSDLRHALLERSLEERGTGPGAGAIATLAGRGLDALDVYVGRCVPDLVLAGAAPLLLVAVIAATDWISAIAVAVSLGLFPLFAMLVGRASGDLARQRWAGIAALGTHLIDLFDGLAVLKAFGRGADERAHLEQMGEQLRRASLATLRLAFLSALVLDSLASISTALVAVPIGIRLASGSMSLYAGLGVLLVTPEVFLPLRKASAEFHDSAEGLAAAGAALDLLGAPPALRTHRCGEDAGLGEASGTQHHAAPDPSLVSVRLLDVSVRHLGRQRPVLEHADLEVEPGETVALVGANGTGKSTLLSLVIGFIVPDSGVVRVGDQDLSMLDAAAWRRRCAYLPERPTLLPATLADNILLAAPGAGPDSVLRALGDAQGAALAEDLPNGLQTAVGQGGWTLSAGERQRVALARVLLRDAPLYLLDEPTAHLDDDCEDAVIEALRRRLEGASALIVSHRPAVLALADRILTVDAGRFARVDATVTA